MTSNLSTEEVPGLVERLTAWACKFGPEVRCPVGVGPDPHDITALLAERDRLREVLIENTKNLLGRDCQIDALLASNASLETAALQAAFSDRVDEAGSPLTWQEIALAAEVSNAGLREALTGLVEEFGGSIAQYHKLGPDYTFKDGTEVFEVSTLLDREPLIEDARKALLVERADVGGSENLEPYRSEFGAIFHEDFGGHLFTVHPHGYADAVARALNKAARPDPKALAQAVEALRALEAAEARDLQHQELVAQADAEGWNEVTGGSHLNDDWKHVVAAYEKARNLRAEALRAAQAHGDALCGDCPPVGYPTDATRCLPCPRRAQAHADQGGGNAD